MGTYCVYLGEETGLGGAAASMRIKCQQVKVTISVRSLIYLTVKYVPKPVWSFASLSSKYR